VSVVGAGGQKIKMGVVEGGGGGGLRLLFCGNDFFRKGGSEIVRALVKVRRDFEIEAYLIGDYNHVDYASSRKVDSAEEIGKLLRENSAWLHHYVSMPNCEMLELAKTCHIGLLPTRDDTFGYSVLEFQACGLPCITTDIRALPEVNNNQIGWMLNVPKKMNGCADFSTVEKMRELSETIEHELEDRLREALSNPTLIYKKAMLSLAHIQECHSPLRFGTRLREIYEDSLSN